MKTITFETNFNGKMSNNMFIHIDKAPEVIPPRSVLENTVILIKTLDNSHAPITVKVQHIYDFKLSELTNCHTWPSHGIDNADFLEWANYNKKFRVDKETKLAAYYYKKVKTSAVN